MVTSCDLHGEAGGGAGGTWNRALGRGGFRVPPAFLILTLGGGVESLFLTSAPCSLRG